MHACELVNYIFISVITIIAYFFLKQRTRLLELQRIRERESKLVEKAYFDPLTSLPNFQNIQITLKEQIARCTRQDKSFSVAIIKIYDKSDEVIQESSRRISDSVRNEDIVGHISKNIFILVFNEYLEHSYLDIIIKRVERAFENKFSSKIKDNSNQKISINIQLKNYPEQSTTDELMTYTL